MQHHSQNNKSQQSLAPLSLFSSSSLLSSQSSSMSCYQYCNSTTSCQLLPQTSMSLIISSPSLTIIQFDETQNIHHRKSSAENIMTNDNVQNSDDSCDYRRLLVQLEETERRFDEFWNIHLSRLKQCLELRRFEQDFRELQVSNLCDIDFFYFLINISYILQTNFDSHLKKVSEMTEIGETVSRVDQLIRETKAFNKICQSDVERAEEVISTGGQLINARSPCPQELVQPKCDELSRVCEIVTQRLSKRLETLSKNRDLMERVEKVRKV